MVKTYFGDIFAAPTRNETTCLFSAANATEVRGGLKMAHTGDSAISLTNIIHSKTHLLLSPRVTSIPGLPYP